MFLLNKNKMHFHYQKRIQANLTSNTITSRLYSVSNQFEFRSGIG